MNKHILLVMRWLKDKESVSQEELAKNKRVAHEAHEAYAVDYAAYAAAYAAYAGYAVGYAGYWVNKYFKRTGEDRNEYLKELEK